jgi:Rrf2 family protein
MKFSAQEEYGLRCLMQIARRSPDGSLTIPEISRLEGLTPTHTAKLLMILRKEGFIMSTRGQSGGYTLSRPPSEINVGDVLTALGGKLFDAEFCRKHTGSLDICTHAVDCSVRSLWQVIQLAVDDVLGKVSLADMLGDVTPKPNVTLFETPQRPLAVK